MGTKESLVDIPLNFCVLKRPEKLGMVINMLSGLLRNYEESSGISRDEGHEKD